MGHDPMRYPLEKIVATAEEASSLQPDALPKMKTALGDDDSAVRYWGALGILMRGADAVASSRKELHAALADGSLCVRVVAAEALGRYGEAADLDKALSVLLDVAANDKETGYAALMAVNAIDLLDKKAAGVVDKIEALQETIKSTPERARGYIQRILEKMLADLKG